MKNNNRGKERVRQRSDRAKEVCEQMKREKGKKVEAGG